MALPASTHLLNGKTNSFIINPANDNSASDNDENQAGNLVSGRKARERLAGKKNKNNNNNKSGEIEINPDAENIKDFFKKIAQKLLRSPSGEASNIGLDIFPEEEEVQYQINQEIINQQSTAALDEIQQVQHDQDDLNDSSSNDPSAISASIGETTIHNAYWSAARSFKPKARCFATKTMKKYLEDGELGKISDFESETTALSAGRVADPDTIADHVPEDGRLLVTGPPSVGKTRFGLMMTKSQPFLSRPSVYLPVDYLFPSSSTSASKGQTKSFKEALTDFFSDLGIAQEEGAKISTSICDEFRSFPIVWVFDNLEVLVNHQPSALERIEVGSSDSDVATLDRDSFVFLSRDGLPRDVFFQTFNDITEWRLFRWSAHDEKGFIWAACGETHPFVSLITSTVLRAFEANPQLALLRGCPTTTHILALLAMRGSNLKHVKCLSEAFELLIHLIIADEKKVKNAITAISKEARIMVAKEITHLSFEATQHAKQGWFHSLVASGLLAIVASAEQHKDKENNNNNNNNEGHDANGVPDKKTEPTRVAFRNRFVAELFAHLNLFQSDDEGSKEPHTWSWSCLKWDRADRVLWTLVAGRVASRAANGNPRELFAFHAASQFFLFYNDYRSAKGTAAIHDIKQSSSNRNATLCSLVVELSHHLGANLLIQEILNQHGLYSRPPSHLRWMVPLCGRFGASVTLNFLVDKLKTRGNPQPLSISEMSETYIEAVLSGQRPPFFAEMNKIIDVNFELRQSALFGALSPLIFAIEDARRTRQAQSPAFLKKVSTCLAEAEKRGDREITNALLSALPIADTLMKQFFQVGDAALSCMVARKRLWIHYAQLWHAHPTMPWESVGCFSTETLELHTFENEQFKNEVIAGTHQQHHQISVNNSSNSAHDSNPSSPIFPTSSGNYHLRNLIFEEIDQKFKLTSDEQEQQNNNTGPGFFQQGNSSPTFTQIKNKFTIRCSPANAHEHFASKKITLIEGSPFVGKTTFGLQLCMIQPFPDHVCVYFDLRSLMLLTREHQEQQEKLLGAAKKKDGENQKTENEGGLFASLLFGGKKNNNKKSKNGEDDNDNRNIQLPTTLREFWTLMGLQIDERAPVMWIFDNCGRLSKEVDACVLSLLSEIASSSAHIPANNNNNNHPASPNNLNNNNSNNFGASNSGSFPSPTSATTLSSISSSASPRSKDRVILLSRILRNGARYLAKDIIFSNMKTWVMPPRSAEQESKIIFNYLQRAANISLHLANQGDGGEQFMLAMRHHHSTIDDEGAPVLIPSSSNHNNEKQPQQQQQQQQQQQNEETDLRVQEESRHRQMAAAAIAASTLDLDPTQTRDQITDNLYQARLLRQQQLQDSYNEMVSKMNDPNFTLAAPSTIRGSGMVLKWICRLTATMNDPAGGNNNNNSTEKQFPDVSDPLAVIEQEMRRRCKSVGITNSENQTALIQTTCVAALRSLVAGFPFPLIRDKSPATDAISVADLHNMLMCQFVHAAPDLKRQDCEFKASEVELFAALSLRICCSKTSSSSSSPSSSNRRHLSLLSWRGEFEAVWLLAAASLSNQEFATVASDCLERILPAKSSGCDGPPPFIPFFLLLEASDVQPFLVSRALEIGTNLRRSHLTSKIGLSSLCGLFGAVNVLRDHLVATHEKSLASFERDRMEAVVSACSYFSKDLMDDLLVMLNDLQGGASNKDDDDTNNNGNGNNDDDDDSFGAFGSPIDLTMNASFAPHVIKKMLASSNINSLYNNNNNIDVNNNNNNFVSPASPLKSQKPKLDATVLTSTSASQPLSPGTSSNNNNQVSRANLFVAADSGSNQPQQAQQQPAASTTTTSSADNNNKNSSPLDPISKKVFKFIKIPNGFFARRSAKIIKFVEDFDPASDKQVPYLLWIDEEDQSKKSKTKFFGIKAITRDASDKRIFTLELPERSVTLEATNEDDVKLWVDCVQEYIASKR